MERFSNAAFSRRLLIASLAFGAFVLCDIALFGWLIFRSLSQREIERVLIETRTEAETLAHQIERRAERQGKDLYTAVASERETQTYIDSILRRREIVQTVSIRDNRGVLVFQGKSQADLPVPQETDGPTVGELDSAELPHVSSEKRKTWTSTYKVDDIKVPIGDMGMLQIGISPIELSSRIEILRADLIRQAALIGAFSLLLLVSSYAAIWWLLRRARRLEVQAAEAERLAYIGTLASGLAHEIRNPLNSLNLNMQMLEEEIDETGSAPMGKRLLSITRSELSRLERLVTDFLAYAKPRPLELEEIPAVRLLERIREVLAGEIQKRGAQVELEDRSAGSRVRVDLGQMNQLFLNLVQNALMATEGSGRPPVLRFAASRQGGTVTLEVTDNGGGIPAEELAKIFDLFYSTRKGGTGLGLAIVERIARAHGGRVSVKSTVGVGTTMTVELPAVSHAEPAPRSLVESSAGA
jgi:signal transduction histidine kinase